MAYICVHVFIACVARPAKCPHENRNIESFDIVGTFDCPQEEKNMGFFKFYF